MAAPAGPRKVHRYAAEFNIQAAIWRLREGLGTVAQFPLEPLHARRATRGARLRARASRYAKVVRSILNPFQMA